MTDWIAEARARIEAAVRNRKDAVLAQDTYTSTTAKLAAYAFCGDDVMPLVADLRRALDALERVQAHADYLLATSSKNGHFFARQFRAALAGPGTEDAT